MRKDAQALARGQIAVFLVLGCALSSCFFKIRPVSRGGVPLAPAAVPALLAGTPDGLNAKIADIYDAISSFQATRSMTASIGSVYRSAAITEVTEGARAFVLFRKPDSTRMIGQAPIIGTTIFDMVSAGRDFKLSLPPKNLFVIGSNSAPPDSKNTFENLRPTEFLSAILIRPADLSSERIYIEDDTDLDHSWSVLHITRKGPGDTDLPGRSVWFNRVDLGILRQRVYDSDGLIVSDTKYDKWQRYSGVLFPAHIDASFKKDGYGVSMNVVDMRMNVEVTDEKFQLEQPAGSTLRVTGTSAVH